ncbi:TetR/AcrR family transcriptional regulator [Streptomyces mirabilis]|uniref:TetR/AcrR family transcriptional regulator n=1 Tax=Streptomyces mirabilis TaxID=68239 RepID=UPI0036A5E737
METESVSRVSGRGGQRADVIVEAAGRLFLAPGSARASMDDLARELGMSKKTIYRHFPDKRSLLAAVLDRQFTAVERTLAAAQDAQGQPFGVRVQRFLIAAGSELGRIGAARLAAGRGGAMRCCASTWSSAWTRWSTGGWTNCFGTGTGRDCCRRRPSC